MMKTCYLAGLLGTGMLLVSMTASAEGWPGGFNPLMSPMSPGMNSVSPLGMGGMTPFGYGMNPLTGYSGMGNNFSPWNSFGSGTNGLPWNMNGIPWGNGNNSNLMPWNFFNGSNYNNSRRNNNDWVGNMFLLDALNGNQLGAGLLPPLATNGINGMPGYAPVYTPPAGQTFTVPIISAPPAMPAEQLPSQPVSPQNFNPFARVAPPVADAQVPVAPQSSVVPIPRSFSPFGRDGAITVTPPAVPMAPAVPQPPAPVIPLRQELVFPDGSRF